MNAADAEDKDYAQRLLKVRKEGEGAAAVHVARVCAGAVSVNCWVCVRAGCAAG